MLCGKWVPLLLLIALACGALHAQQDINIKYRPGGVCG